MQEKNFVKIFDLQHEIDYQSKENVVVYANDYLEVTLVKKEDIIWTDLTVQDLSKEEQRERREKSFKRKEEVIQQKPQIVDREGYQYGPICEIELKKWR